MPTMLAPWAATPAAAAMFAGYGSASAEATPCWIFTIASAMAKAFEMANSTRALRSASPPKAWAICARLPKVAEALCSAS